MPPLKVVIFPSHDQTDVVINYERIKHLKTKEIDDVFLIYLNLLFM